MANSSPQTTIKKKPGRPKKKLMSPKQATYVNALELTGNRKQALKEAGYSPTAIPESFKVVQNAIADRQKEMRKKFMDDAEEMRQTILDISRYSRSDAVRLQAAKDILDRAGLNPINKSQTESAKYVSIESRISREALDRYSKEVDLKMDKKKDGEG